MSVKEENILWYISFLVMWNTTCI